MEDRLLEYIVNTAKMLRKGMEANLPGIRSEISSIIAENSRDIKKIENLLDILLDYRQMGVGEREFKRLNKYYASFNAGNAKFYSDAYDEE